MTSLLDSFAKMRILIAYREDSSRLQHEEDKMLSTFNLHYYEQIAIEYTDLAAFVQFTEWTVKSKNHKKHVLTRMKNDTPRTP